MAVPKKKKSKSQRGMHRAHHALTPPSQSTCTQCGEIKLPHRVCASCGHYRGRQIFQVESEDEV